MKKIDPKMKEDPNGPIMGFSYEYVQEEKRRLLDTIRENMLISILI